MNKGAILFLKSILVLVGMVVLVGMLWLPRIEGRNIGASNFDIYLRDPFLAYVYLASTPFFVGLYQAFKLLGNIQHDRAFSTASVRSLQLIKYCALAVIGFLIAALLYIRFIIQGDDPAGPTMLGFVAIATCVVISTTAAVLQRLMQSAVDLQSEQELTV